MDTSTKNSSGEVSFFLNLSRILFTALRYNFEDESTLKKVIEFGSVLLLECFRLHNSIRGEILDQMFTRIIIKSDNVSYYIRLLSKIIAEFTHFVLDYEAKVSEDLQLSFR